MFYSRIGLDTTGTGYLLHYSHTVGRKLHSLDLSPRPLVRSHRLNTSVRTITTHSVLTLRVLYAFPASSCRALQGEGLPHQGVSVARALPSTCFAPRGSHTTVATSKLSAFGRQSEQCVSESPPAHLGHRLGPASLQRTLQTVYLVFWTDTFCGSRPT